MWEWLLDWYAAPYTNPCTNCANLTAVSPPLRSARGGSFLHTAAYLATSLRFYETPTRNDLYHFGARCARNP
jgi:formylglycine-generating enzyme required for sulfatase activity